MELKLEKEDENHVPKRVVGSRGSCWEDPNHFSGGSIWVMGMDSLASNCSADGLGMGCRAVAVKDFTAFME